MASINLYENSINDKKMSLVVSKHNSKISECKLFEKKEFVFIGVSLGNSYFSQERLELIIRGFSKNFQRVVILLVDELSVHNFQAMGYEEKKIKKKIRLSSNKTRNKIKNMIAKTNTIYGKNNIEFYQWNHIKEYDIYHEYLSRISDLYESNKYFRMNILEITGQMIKKYLNVELEESVATEEAKWYLLKELAFGCCINEIFEEKEILLSYYNDFKFYREFFENNYLNISRLNKQEFIIYSCDEYF